MTTSTARVPCTIITGFLGAGKTTLLRHLLKNAGAKKIAVIINEFGDVGVDRQIINGCGDASCPADRIVELANGCLCCTVADDFAPALDALLTRADPPDHILIETSGLALPKPLVQAFQWPTLRNTFTVDAVVTVVDAPAVAAGDFADDPAAVDAQRRADDNLDHDSPLHELFEDQLATADLVVVHKTDGLTAAQLADVEAAIRLETAPGVKLVPLSLGTGMPYAALLVGSMKRTS